jgi:hypothetical protein
MLIERWGRTKMLSSVCQKNVKSSLGVYERWNYGKDKGAVCMYPQLRSYPDG